MAETLLQCSVCGKEKRLTEYYNTSSPIHVYHGKLSACKDCLSSMVDMNDARSLMDTMRMVDKPFLINEYEGSLEKDANQFGEYMRRLAMRQNRDKSWDDSEFGDKEIKKVVTVEDSGSNEYIDLDYLENKWGSGYTEQEYQYFEKKYNTLKHNYPEKTSMHTEALLTYIRYRVKEELATSRGEVKEAKEWGNLASKAAQDAKINPSQLSQSDLTGGLDTVGQLVRAVEQVEDIIPVLPQFKSSPKDKPDFAIWSYINYARDLEGKSLVKYEDVYRFYEDRKKEYEDEFGKVDEVDA